MTQSKALAPVDALKKSLSQMSEQFSMALPKHVGVDKFVRVLQTAVASTPALVGANRTTLFAACMKAAQDGLLPDGREAAIVTFNTKSGVVAQYMPMIAGILKKVRNSGELSSITSNIVFENDVFEYFVDADGEHIKHVPNIFADRGKRLGAYALAKTKDGGIYIEVMTEAQINDVKQVSRSKDKGPWAGSFSDEMRKKSVLRRLAKKLPMSTDIEMTLKADDDLFMGEDEDTVIKNVTPEPAEQPAPAKEKKATKSSKLSKVVKEAAPSQDEEAIDIEHNEAAEDVFIDTPVDEDEMPL